MGRHYTQMSVLRQSHKKWRGSFSLIRFPEWPKTELRGIGVPGKGMLLDDPLWIAGELQDIRPEAPATQNKVGREERQDETQPPAVISLEVLTVRKMVPRDHGIADGLELIRGPEPIHDIGEAGGAIDDERDIFTCDRLIDAEPLPCERPPHAAGQADNEKDAEEDAVCNAHGHDYE
jgi:hypothetical protein